MTGEAVENLLTRIKRGSSFGVTLSGFNHFLQQFDAHAEEAAPSDSRLEVNTPLDWGQITFVAQDGTNYSVSNLLVVVVMQKEQIPESKFWAEFGDETSATLYCCVNKALFSALMSPAANEIKIRFTLEKQVPLALSPPYEPFGDKEKPLASAGTFAGLVDVAFTIKEKRKLSPRQAKLSFKQREQAVSQFAVHVDSQLGLIASELMQDLADKVAVDPAFDSDPDDRLKHMNELFWSLRTAARNNEVEFPQDIEASRKLLAEARSNKKGPELRAVETAAMKRETIWTSRPSLDCILARKIHPDETHELDINYVEEAAKSYLRLNLTSPTLERLLIDAFLFIEIVASARTAFSTPQIAKSTFRRTAVEAGWLAGTGLLALLADAQAGVIFWIVFCSATAVRWLRPIEKSGSTSDQARTFSLIADMAATQGRMTADYVNPRLVRERLYDLERRGAVFSQYVYCFLDAWIARENIAINTIKNVC